GSAACWALAISAAFGAVPAIHPSAQRRPNPLRRERNAANRYPDRVADGVADGRWHRGQTGLAETVHLGVWLRVLGERGREVEREVRKGGDVVVGEVRIRDLT